MKSCICIFQSLDYNRKSYNCIKIIKITSKTILKHEINSLCILSEPIYLKISIFSPLVNEKLCKHFINHFETVTIGKFD